MRTAPSFFLAAALILASQTEARLDHGRGCGNALCAAAADLQGSRAPRQLLHEVNVFAELPSVLVDPRRPQPQTGAGKIYASIGEISTDRPVRLRANGTDKGLTQGTGFLIAPCLVMTNFHAVMGEWSEAPTKEDIERQTATFLVPGRAAARASILLLGKYYDDRNEDYALLKLETCWGTDPEIGWLGLGPLSPNQREQIVSMAGHPGDKDRNALWIQDRCHLFGNRNSFARLTDCSNTRGDSGSPIMFYDDGMLKVAAIIRSERQRTERVLPTYDDAHANVSVDIFRILRHDPPVAKAIAQNVLSFYRTVIKDMPVPDDIDLCGRENLRVPEVLRCAAAVNLLSARALAAASRRTGTLGDDELQNIWLSAKP